MKLIVGLGNPDDKYKNTFHNLGFMCVDKAVGLLNESFNKTKCKAEVCELKIGTEKVIFAKPQTYMNLSGESLRELISFYKIDIKDVMVLYDDFDLNKGVVRIRDSGSAGTHNGMRNIVELIGKTNFARVRIGFKPTGEFNIPLINYVLSGIKEEDKEIYDKAILVGAKCAIDFANGKDIQAIMQKYNGKVN